MSVSSVDSGITVPSPTTGDLISHDKSNSHSTQEEAHTLLDRIKDPTGRAHLFSNVFCHLRNAESRFFANDNCVMAMESAIKEIKYLDTTQTTDLEIPPVVTKEMARKWIRSTFSPRGFENHSYTNPDGQDIMTPISSMAFEFP